MTESSNAAATDLSVTWGGNPPAPPSPQPAPSANLPAPPGGIVNPGTQGYIDQQGNLRATLSSEQLASARADWLAVFDNQARTARAHGDDLTPWSSEAR